MEVHLNRSVIIIIPQKPFFDWINYLEPVHPIHVLQDHNSILLPIEYSYQDAADFIKKNYDLIFEDHLFSMWTAEEEWPQKRTFKVFNEWFSWQFSSMIVDSVDNLAVAVGPL